jgi:kynurenine formamidase
MNVSVLIMNFNKVIELSHTIENNMPYYPGDPEPKIEIYKSISKDGVNIKKLQMGTHTGTHVDAPAHFLENGKHVNELDPMAYSGEGIVINVAGKKEIEEEDINDSVKDKIALFYTGTSQLWKPNWKMQEFSYFNVEAARKLAYYKAKAVGIDSPSVESPLSANGIVHKTLLSNNIVIIENISNNIKELIDKRFYVLCFPLLVKDGDGAPARVIGVIE